jgi:hypothetical protein
VTVLVPLPSRRTSQDGPEVTRFYPREGRAAPAHLRAVPEPPAEERTVYARDSGRLTWKDILQLRGELPPTRGPSRKAPPAHVSPWNRKGFVYPEADDSQGKNARVHRSSQEDMERIRATPKNLAALLKTPEWKGARVVGTVPNPGIGEAETLLAAAVARLNEAKREIDSLEQRLSAATEPRVRETLEASRRSMWLARDARSKAVGERQGVLDGLLLEEWVRVVHPSGAELRIRPTY